MKPRKPIRRTPLKRKPFKLTTKLDDVLHYVWGKPVCIAAKKYSRTTVKPISKKALWKQIADRYQSNMKAATALEHLAKKPLRRETPKRASEQRRYRRDSQAWLRANNHVCTVCLKLKLHPEPATQTHHKYGKNGRLLNWQPGWMGVSSFGQFWIHNHPTQAYKLGLLGPVGTWNDFERAKNHLSEMA